MTVPDDAASPPAAGSPEDGAGQAGRPVAAPRAGAHVADGLVDALDTLRARLGALRLPLEAPGAGAARTDLRRAIDQLDDYLLPRLRAHRAPLLVVVGGSTGAGKSTLVNSVLGERVSRPGVLRPTTRAPVLVHNPLDERWFSTDRVLPGLARVSSAVGHRPATGGVVGPTSRPGPPGATDAPARTIRLTASEALPQGLALLDAPDIDSVETANRELAAQLLGAADLWLFVTTAARYADAVPWDLLKQASARKAQVAMVLDRVDPGAEATADDLRAMMAEQGLGDSPLFVVPEAELEDDLLPERAVAEISTWLTGLGGDATARDRVIAATRDGVVDSLVDRALALADAADTQEAADARLRLAVTRAYEDAAAHVAAATSDGALLRGEVLARWQDFVGTGEFFRAVEQSVGRVRDAIGAFFRGKPRQAPQVEQAIAHGLESVVLDAAEEAAERSYQAWRGDAAGEPLLEGLGLSRAPASLRGQVGEQIRGWQGDVLDLVRDQGAAKRGTARILSLGVNGLGVILMVVVFASTGGLTGVEVGIAGGTALLAQRLLEAVFGEDAVRRLAVQARERLRARVQAVMDGQAARYTAQLDALGSADAGGPGLRAAAAEVEAAARLERAGRAGPADAGVQPGVLGRPLRGAGARGAGSGAGSGAGWRRTGSAGAPAGAAATVGTGEAKGRRGFWRRLLGLPEADAGPGPGPDANPGPDAGPTAGLGSDAGGSNPGPNTGPAPEDSR